MRRFIEALIDRFDQGITIEKHIDLINHFFHDSGEPEARIENDPAAIAVVLQSAIPGIGEFYSSYLRQLSASKMIDIARLRDIEEKGQFETSPEIQLIQLTCLGDSIGKKGEFWLGSELREISKGSSWKGSNRQIARSRVLFTFIFCGVKSGDIRVEDATDILASVIENLPPEDWFPSAGALYGTSYILRSFLALRNCPGVFADYARDVSERLLRHVEIRRRRALPFRTESVPVDASYLLERIRFTLSILDAADLYCDARYLNAALKANDWHYGSIRRMKVPSKLTPEKTIDLMIILHYIMSIANQERLWGKFLNK